MLVMYDCRMHFPLYQALWTEKTYAYGLNTSNTNALMTDMWQQHQDTQMQCDINGEICLWSYAWKGKNIDPPASCL